MAYRLEIDELNTPDFDAEAYIESYFKPMRISREEKETRKQAARDFRDYLLTLFLLLGIQTEYLAVNWTYIEDQMRVEFERVALKYANNSKILTDYIADKASDFVRVTRENMGTDKYWLSDERATYEAVNEANEVLGIADYQKAIESGMRFKRWKGMMDSRERKSHVAMEGKKIPINDFFHLEKGILRFPSDFEYCPAESYNCRCSCKYSKN